MDVIPAFLDLGAFASRSFTATDFFAAFRAFGAFAFFVVLAICSPDADASTAGRGSETRTHLLTIREVAPARSALAGGRSFTSTDVFAALRAGFLPFALARVFPRRRLCHRRPFHPRSERYSCTTYRFMVPPPSCSRDAHVLSDARTARRAELHRAASMSDR